MFCRVRPVLPGESMGRDSSWSQGSGAEVEPKLAVTFPDVNRDCKKISLEYLSDQVKGLYERNLIFRQIIFRI